MDRVRSAVADLDWLLCQWKFRKADLREAGIDPTLIREWQRRLELILLKHRLITLPRPPKPSN